MVGCFLPLTPLHAVAVIGSLTPLHAVAVIGVSQLAEPDFPGNAHGLITPSLRYTANVGVIHPM
jgi:hypothetical protein